MNPSAAPPPSRSPHWQPDAPGPPRKADLHTAQAFEALWAGLTCVVNGAWRSDADAGVGMLAFASKNDPRQQRRAVARDSWVDDAD